MDNYSRHMQEIFDNSKMLERYFDKLIQAFRLRLKCMGDRERLLQRLKDNPALRTTPEFTNELARILKNERRLLKIILDNDKGPRNNLHHLLIQLHDFMVTNGSEVIMPRSQARMDAHHFYSFLQNVIEFLEMMDGEIWKIERRIKKEEKYLEEQTPDAFKEFLLQWDDEMVRNVRFLKHFKKVFSKNYPVIDSLISLETRTSMVMIGTTSMLIAGFGYDKFQQGIPSGGFVMAGGALILAITVAAFGINALYNQVFCTTQFKDEFYSHELLEEMERTYAARKTIWQKLFGV